MNPSTDKFSYSIYSVTGKLVTSRDNITGSEIAIDMSGLAKGMYFIQLSTESKHITRKAIVE